MSRPRAVSLALALRDLRGGAKRLRIFVACLALGVAAIAGVGSLGAAVRAGIAADARTLLGGDLELRLAHREITQEQRDFLTRRAELSEVAQLRAMARRADNAERRLVELKAVDGAYPLAGAVQLAPGMGMREALGRSDDGRWGAVAERALFDRLRVEVGDEILVGENRYVLRAVLEREPDRGVQAFFGPRLIIALESLPDTGLLQPGSLVYRHYRLAAPAPGAPEALTAELRARFPNAAWRVRGLDEAAPGLQRFVRRTELYLTLVALSALLVGGLGVAHAISAWLETRIQTIAILKSVGAGRGVILRTYAAQAALFAAVGILIGLAIGAALPWAAAAPLGERLGVAVRPTLYPAPLGLAALFGALTAALFTLWPLARDGRDPAGNTVPRPRRARRGAAVALGSGRHRRPGVGVRRLAGGERLGPASGGWLRRGRGHRRSDLPARGLRHGRAGAPRAAPATAGLAARRRQPAPPRRRARQLGPVARPRRDGADRGAPGRGKPQDGDRADAPGRRADLLFHRYSTGPARAVPRACDRLAGGEGL